jgi:hypothetical protein
VDRLITLAKKGNDASRRLAFDRTRDAAVVKKLFDTLAGRYQARAGGYTRVLKMADRRWGDAAEMAVLELVDHAEIVRGKKAKGPKAEKAAAEQTPADPMARIRKVFAGKSRTKAAAEGKTAKAPKAPKAAKSAAPRKTQAGGKSGGSSS